MGRGTKPRREYDTRYRGKQPLSTYTRVLIDLTLSMRRSSFFTSADGIQIRPEGSFVQEHAHHGIDPDRHKSGDRETKEESIT